MKKIIAINGMTCEHCKARVEKALNGIAGVEAKVDLKQKTATVKLSNETEDSELRAVIEDAGYEVVSITEKKGLFS